MERFFLKNLVVGGLASLLLAVLLSCGEDAGLGASIDTKAPTLSITYPDAGVAVRDSFILAGDCSDDKSITRVMVSVKNLESGVGYGTFLANIAPSQASWQVTLNEYDPNNPDFYNGWQLPDGKYEVSVTAYDNAGNNSGVSSRQFEIDNTPPVFIISNPGVVKSSNKTASAYGSIFTIDGTISDNHTISFMDVKIFDKAGNVVSHESYEGSAIDFYREEDIATAGGTSVTIAQHGIGDRYSNVYPEPDSADENAPKKYETKEYYAEITLYDSAKVYKNPPVGSSRSAAEIAVDKYGNSTSKLYLYDDVYTSLMSSKKGMGLSAANLRDIISGVSKDESSSTVLALLNEKVKDTAADSENRLYFTLNPEANPKYNVTGYTFGYDEDSVVQSAANGYTITLSVDAGLDGTLVDPSTIKVWMKKYAKDAKPGKDGLKTEIQSLAAKVLNSEKRAKADGEATIPEKSFDDWNLIFDNYTYNGSNVAKQSYSVTLPSSGITLGDYYIIVVTGYDVEDLAFSQNTQYGFVGNVAGVAPTLEITTPSEDEIGKFVKPEEIIFEGTAKIVGDESLKVAKLVATVKATGSSGLVGNTDGYAATLSRDNLGNWISTNSTALSFSENAGVLSWKFDPKEISGFLDATKDTATKYSLDLYGESSSGHGVHASSMVQLDTTNPVVTITTVTPTISGSDVSDVVKKSNGYAADNVYINGTIRIMGSIVEQNLKAVTYDILATSDLSKDIAEKDADGKYKNSILSQLEAATRGRDVYYDGHLETSNSIDIKFMTANVTQGMLAAHVIEKDQPIKIRVILTAEDEVGNKGEYSSNTYNNGKDFLIYQETDRPQITLGNAFEDVDAESKINVDKNLFLTTSNKLSVTFSDDDGVNSYKITLKNSAGNEIDAYSQTVTPNKAFTSGSKTLTLPSEVGVYKVQVEATDENYLKTDLNASGAYGIATSKEFFVAIDNGAPTVTADSVAAYLSLSNAISGSISPSAKGFGSGTTISAKFLDSELNELATQPATLAANKNGTTWSFPLSSMPSNKSGSYTLRITATDKYGQTGSTTVKFGMDPNAPTIDATNFTAQTVKLDESNFVTFKADAKDEDGGSGIATFGYYLSENNSAPANYGDVEWKPLNQTNDGWNVTFDIFQTKNEDGTLYAFLAAKDNAGNTTICQTPATLTIDKAAPTSTVSITNGGKVLNQSKAELGGSGLEFGKIYYTNKSFTLGGTITETNLDVSAANKPKLNVKKDGGTETPLVFTSGGNASGDWTYVPSYAENGTADGQYVYTLTVKDKVGSVFSKSVTVILDTKAPTVDFTSPANGENFESAPSAKIAYSDDGVGIDTSKIVYTITDESGNKVASSNYDILNGGATGSVSFKSTFNTEGSFKISASVSDYFGNKTETTQRSFYYDKAKPTVEETKVGSSGITTNAGFTMGGKVSDSNGLKSLRISDGNEKSWDIDVSGTEKNWTKDFVVGDSNKNKENYIADGSYSFTIVVTDVAGKTTQLSRSVKVDTVAPTFGNGTEIEKETGYNKENVRPHVATSSVVVGGKAWYKTNDLKIAGTASDGAGTGISEVYFETSTDGSSWSGKTDLAGTRSWSGTVSGVVSGETFIRVTVVDNAGNSATSPTFGTFSIDTKEPELKEGTVKIGSSSESASAATSYLSNGDSNIFVSFAVTDENGGSGIDSVYVLPYEKVSDTTKVDTNKATLKEDGTASFTIAKSNITKSGTVYARIFDKAGNYTDSNVFSLTFDKDPPTVTLNNPADASAADGIQINGKIKLSGTANDTNMLDKITGIEYSTNDSDWTDASSLMEPISGSYSFSAANFDTTKLADGEYFLRAVAKDTAGNEGKSKSVKVTVSQNTDRPTVKVANITKSGSEYFLKYGTNAQISGSISDDDSTSSAVVKVFKASGKPIELKDKKIDESKLEGVTTFNPASGEWTFTPDNKDDGPKDVYYYIEDSEGGIFYTGNDSTLNQPYFQYKTDDAEDNASNLTYKSDSKSPVISGTLVSDNGTAFDGTAVSTTGTTLSSSYVAGGSKKKTVSFTITATDASGIAGLTADIYYVDSEKKTHYVANKATNWDENENDGKKYIAGVVLVETDDEKYTKDDSSWAQTTTGDDTSWTWTTGEIDVSKVPTGSLTLNITPYDKAGLTGNQSYTFNIDNTAPDITVRTPVSGTEVTGSVEISGTTSERGSAGTANIQWIVPTTDEVTTAGKKSGAEKITYLKGLKWNGGKDSLASGTGLSAWQFNFDGNYDETTSTPAQHIYKAGNPLFTAFDKADFAQNSDYATTELYQLPVWFMATDELGNTSVYTDFFIKHNPDWDKPKIEFTYPTKEIYKSATEKYAVLGGTIRATGSAEIPSGTTTVKAIYYQIADAKGEFSATDKEKAKAAVAKDASGKPIGYGYKVVDAYTVINGMLGSDTYSASSTISEEQLKKFGFASRAALDAWWGIEATGTASWNIKLNSNGELNPPSGKTTDITIRACGVNAEGKFGAWSSGDNVIAIHVDNTAPVISSAVNQYANGTSAITARPTATYTSSQTYEDDMYLRGNWTLVATLLDETSVTGYSVLKGNSALTAGTDYFVETGVSDTSISKSGVRLYIPIPKTEDNVDITVNANDADHTSTQTFKFKIDEAAPTLASLKANGTAFDSTSFSSIEDSNYQFVLSGASTDEGSGVEHVLFYYMRKSGTTQTTIGTNVVMDPMITTSTADSKVAMSDLKEREFAQGSEKFYLYAKKYSGTATTDTFTSGTAYDAHVRVGGVVEIDGILHRISKIDGMTVTFTPSLAAAKTTSFDAYFPIAQVIDNSATEKVKSSSGKNFVFEKGDDDDGMPESFSKSGKTWTWDATIHTTNMPDGPVSLVILAFDNAGNVAGKRINTKITNNAPRLAKVFLGTDLSGDGKYTNSSSITEIVEYNIIGAEGNTQSAYTLDFNEKLADESAKYPNGVFKIKNGLAVIPELTGGNGSVGMILNTSATDATPVKGTVTAAVSSRTNGTDEDGKITATFTGTVAGTFTGSNKDYQMHSYVVDSGKLGDDGTDKGMSFTFWDSTEETTQGTNSQNAVLYVKNFTVAQDDSNNPTVVVNPFYWNSLNSNSIYGSADTETVSSVSALSGHIELESDWKNATGYKEGETTGQYDGDPKVSGKITFTGTAYDDARLGTLTVQFGTFLSTATTVATYDSTKSEWTVPTKTMASDGYEFHVTDATGTAVGNYSDSVYFSQKGHKVYWTLSIDTSKISTVAEKDVSLTVIATDHKGNSTVTTAVKPDTTDGYKVTDGTTNVPTYQMDVVPYITKVTTSLSSIKRKNPSVFDRTALGHYPVRLSLTNKTNGTAQTTYTGETVTFEGFNLGTNTSYTVTAATASGKDGKYDLKVNGIKAVNNINDNNAKGSYDKAVSATSTYEVKKTYAYNRVPNNDNNNLLTDDVYFDVWQFDSRAAVPISGKIEQPVMKINPVTGQLGFAFVNGPLYFSMGGASDHGATSYDYWMGSYDFFTSVGFAYDSLGYSYGVAAGGDINSSSADKFQLMTSRWGNASRAQNGSYSSSNSLRLESIGQKDSAGTNNFDKQRIKSPSIATSVHDNDTNLYMAYYDAMNDEVRFKAGNFGSKAYESYICKIDSLNDNDGGSNVGVWIKQKYKDSYNISIANGNYFYICDSNGNITDTTRYHLGGYWDGVAAASGLVAFTSYNDSNKAVCIVNDTIVNNSTAGKASYVDVKKLNDDVYIKILAERANGFGDFVDYDTDGAPYQYRNSTVSIIASGDLEGRNAGEYVSIAVVPGTTATNDVVVAVWYDQTERKMLYSYNTSPLTDRSGTTNAEGWSAATPIFSGDMENSGEYCQITVDGNKGIHIAAYDPVNCDLVYAYLASYNGTPKTCVVDSNGVLGSNITIDVAIKDGKAVPQIGYYATSCIRPKLAYLYDTAATEIAGSKDDEFTGVWECTVVPTNSSVNMQSNQYNKMNVGVWKNGSGTLTSSTTDKSFANNNWSNSPNSYGSTSYGYAYGNGTANAVMGYTIKVNSTTDAIETAQMK